MLITEMIAHLEDVKKVHGDLPIVKWELDSSFKEITEENFLLLPNHNFDAEKLVIK